MTLQTISDPQAIRSRSDVSASYVVFYASRDETGKMWCPDCRAVENLIETTFGGDKEPSAVVIYVGHKPEWKAPLNACRAEPWKIEAVPTIVRLKEGREIGRLVEGEILEQLERFIKE